MSVSLLLWLLANHPGNGSLPALLVISRPATSSTDSIADVRSEEPKPGDLPVLEEDEYFRQKRDAKH